MLEADVEVDRRDFTVRAALSVAAGERLALFGPSGSGKTTLLETIAGLIAPRRGLITLAGRVLTSISAGQPVTWLPPWQRRVGLLRQDPGLFPHLSVRDNLRYGRTGARRARGRTPLAEAGTAQAEAGTPQAEVDAELAELADVLGIDGLLAAMPARLSGGQAHRVALGRLLLAHCDALLLDEPYTGLDASLRRTLTDMVIALVGQRRVPAILVAHELAEAQAFADRLAVLDWGSVLQVGTPDEVVLRPASRRVAELVGYTAFVPLPDGGAAGLHPDRILAGRHPDAGLVLAGPVSGCRPAGALWEIALTCGEVAVTARLADPAPIGGDLGVTATSPPCFGPDGVAVASPVRAATGSAPAGRSGRPQEGR